MPTNTPFHGYHEAAKIDAQINKIFLEQPLTKENVCEWMNFSRTVQTSLNIIDLGIRRVQVEVIPPTDGWKPQTWYLVDVKFFPTNLRHRQLFYSGFLIGDDCTPGGYNCFADLENQSRIQDVHYLKVIREVCSQKELKGG